MKAKEARKKSLLDMWEPPKPKQKQSARPAQPAASGASPAVTGERVVRYVWGLHKNLTSARTQLQTSGINMQGIQIEVGDPAHKLTCVDATVAYRLRNEVQRKLSSLNRAIKITNRPTPRAPRQQPTSAWNVRPALAVAAEAEKKAKEAAAVAAAPRVPAPAAARTARFTVPSPHPCWEHSRTGKCSRSVCRFQHQTPAVPGPQQAASSGAQAGNGHQVQQLAYTKRFPCHQWVASGFKSCRFGDKCKFGHQDPPTHSPAASPPAPARRGPVMCFQWKATGMCPYQDACYRVASHTKENQPA